MYNVPEELVLEFVDALGTQLSVAVVKNSLSHIKSIYELLKWNWP